MTIQPVLFTLLFIYVFGSGVILPGGGSYKDFAIAGLLVLNLTTSAMGTAVGLSTDLNSGVIDRFRTLPDVAPPRYSSGVRSPTCWRRPSAPRSWLLTGLAIGWRPDASFLSTLAGFGVVPAVQPTRSHGAAPAWAWSARDRSRRRASVWSSSSRWPSSPTPWCPPSTCPLVLRDDRRLEPGERRDDGRPARCSAIPTRRPRSTPGRCSTR